MKFQLSSIWHKLIDVAEKPIAEERFSEKSVYFSTVHCITSQKTIFVSPPREPQISKK
jgi:hypothetical protein